MSLKRAAWLFVAVSFLLAQQTSARDLPRSALWRVVATCVAAKHALDVSVPCLQVDLGKPGSPGVAILRSPWSETHVLVAPTRRLSGIEAAVLQKPEATAYWRAALAARRFVIEAAKGRIGLEDIGLAINSKDSRTQDQLHIHVDCTQPDVLAALRRHDAEFGGVWKPIGFLEPNQRFFGIRIASDEIGASNIFERLMHLPGYRKDLSRVAVAVFSTAPNASRPGFYVVAALGRDSQAEDLLDHSCALARTVSGNETLEVAR